MNDEKLKQDFLKSAGLQAGKWTDALVWVPGSNGAEFYLRFDRIGSKQFVASEHQDKLIAWMRLTEELFLTARI